MKRTAPFYMCFLIMAITAKAQLPIKFDDQYKTIFAKDLCRLAFLNNPDLVLIDVRSPGEYSDTSQYNSLNMGHLKSAINIPIDSIQKNVTVLNPYKNKTLVFYCSHSQRSRRVSLLLSQNGFKNFYNLNGGMSHINQMSVEEFPCKTEWLVSNLKYVNLSSADAIELIKKDPKLIILDVRPAAMFYSRDSLAQNNIGRIKKAINIPYPELKQRFNELANYKDRSILVYSQSGDGDAARTAVELNNNGLDKVSVLMAGLDDLLVQENSSSLIDDLPSFHILNAQGTLSLLQNSKSLTIYDSRPKMEFENKNTRQFYRNLGNIKNAINIEETEFDSYNYPANKEVPVLIYGGGESYKLARKLSSAGYKNVYLLRGFYDFVSSAFNVEGNKDILLYLVNHDGIY